MAARMFSETHAGHLRMICGTQTAPDPEALRRQLAECGEHIAMICADAASRPTTERLDALGIALHGAQSVVSKYRAALNAEARHDG